MAWAITWNKSSFVDMDLTLAIALGLLGSLLRVSSLQADSVWMIGDRTYDYQAARANQIRCIAAGTNLLFGYWVIKSLHSVSARKVWIMSRSLLSICL